MPHKIFHLEGVGDVHIVKRTSSRSIRLSIRGDGRILVSVPAWASYRSGVAFATTKRDWLREHAPQRILIIDGQAVGKFHHVQLLATKGSQKPRSIVTKTAITVRYPLQLEADDQTVQSAAQTACIRALRAQAEQLLPPRLAALAIQHDLDYQDVSIKRLKGRWGSCDSQKHIVLNLFLMQLPWECIDYVLLHELTHTRILQHGPLFWDHMRIITPNLAGIRAQMRGYQPVLQSGRQTVQ